MHEKYKSSRCLKIKENVSFKLASEASYVYNTVWPDRSVLIEQKEQNPKIQKSKCDIFE